MQHEFHEFASMFPLMEGEELDELIADIKTNGQRELIVLLDNKVLDGRNRYIACEKLGIKPRFRNLECVDGDALGYVWSANVTRRHLNQAQKALAAAKMANFMERGAYPRDTISATMADMPKVTSQIVASQAGVSERTITRARQVLKHGTPEELTRIERTGHGLASASERISKKLLEDNGGKRYWKTGTKPMTGVGPKINLPDGVTAEEYTRRGLAMEKDMDIPAIARKLGVADDSYRKMREIVLIADRKDLLPHDRKLADEALEILNQWAQTTHHEMIEPIAHRIWGSSGKFRKNAETDRKRVSEFEKQIEIIRHVCETDLEIPQLSLQQIEYTIEALGGALLGVKGLIKKVKETYNV